ncbi:hypothetical protein [Aquimarina pacifica]|uniref:hypothetical protein n=1 Tax=Aquimarina pacifica TaxID=1296415 RepID=UPI00046E9FF9|nr:hypothetical protein [Aquimarina pacifica]
MKKTYLKTILICCLGIFLTQCELEDGEPGSAGTFGQNGVDGIDGIDGEDGDPATTIDESTQYGKFTLNLTGTRSDNVSFNETAEFLYTGIDISSAPNQVYISETSMMFDIVKFLEIPSFPYQSTYLYIMFQVNNPGEETESYDFLAYINDYPIIFDDLSYIILTQDYDSEDSIVSNFEISNYSFDDETNQLILSYSFDTDVSGNDLLDNLSISGEIDAFVPESYGFFSP